ncbi:glutamate--tRNA ligase [Candidatus Parcubacteria bacterium]|nr:glutamate--tRNA ligase [Candidatus Parcubacteria bacterium]
MSNKKVRTRFAPSPTGFLHIGSLRTALFAHLLAKEFDGEMILRLEDTDQKRYVEGSEEKLYNTLDRLGFKFDEGPRIGGDYGPYIQSQRKKIYNKYIKRLLDEQKVYHCFCSPERLQKMREKQQAEKLSPRYDRCCRNLSAEEVVKKINSGEKFVVRQKMPLEGEVIVNDELRGEIKFQASELEDHVLIKSDGMPTYQFALIVDDHLMEISHVIRGEEWIPSFPKNILLYKDFGWEPPKFIHIPLTLNKGGGKLSKRQGDVAVEDYLKKGYLVEALINFCALLGWHPKGDNEILTLDDLEKMFKYKNMNTSPAIFDIEKLDYFNGYYIRKMDLDKLVEIINPYLANNIKKTSDKNKQTDEFIRNVVSTEQERLKKLSEIGELTEFFFVDKLNYPKDMLIWKKQKDEDCKKNLEIIKNILEKISENEWTKKSIENIIIKYLKDNDLKVGDYLWPTRVALTGKKQSPGPFEVAFVLGKEESLEKIQDAVDLF